MNEPFSIAMFKLQESKQNRTQKKIYLALSSIAIHIDATGNSDADMDCSDNCILFMPARDLDIDSICIDNYHDVALMSAQRGR